jgi:nitroreductase
MQVFEVIEKRRSIRTYKDEPIEKEKIDKLIEAARLAPTAGNRQKFKLIIVNYEEKDLKKRLAAACNEQYFVSTASNIIAGVSEPDYKWHQVDTAIVLEHMVLEAVELGLGTCWIGAFKEDEVKKILKIPEDKKVVVLLVIGYSAESPPSKPRKDVSELVSYNQY